MNKSLRTSILVTGLAACLGASAQVQVVTVYKTDGTTEIIKKSDVSRIVFDVSPEAPAFAGGDGTQESPYQISNAAELLLMAKQVNSGSADYVSAFYELTADIDLTGIAWTPIGQGKGNTNPTLPESGIKFLGLLNGNNYTISGLTLDVVADEPVAAYGLFGMIGNGGTVKNLTVKADINATTAIEDEATKTYLMVGGIVGEGYYCVLDNVHFEGSIAAESTVSEAALTVGGVAGFYTGNLTNSSATIAADKRVKALATYANAGALAGYVYAGTITGNSATVEGTVYATTGDYTTDDATANAGGLIGVSYGGSVSESAVSVSGNVLAGAFPTENAESSLAVASAGGLCGAYAADQLGNCNVTVSGTVGAEGCGCTYTGGVIGQQNNGGYGASNLYANISGTISAINHGTSGAKRIAYAGGIYGMSSYQVSTPALSLCSVDLSGGILANGAVAGYAGGVAGSSTGAVACSANIASTGSLSVEGANIANVGGVVGMGNGNFIACYSVVDGTIYRTESKAGGLGGIIGGISGSKRSMKQILAGYTIYNGKVSAPEDSSIGAIAGSLGNYVDVLSSYWYSQNESVTGEDDYKIAARDEASLTAAATAMNEEIEGDGQYTVKYVYDSESNSLKAEATAAEE